MAAEIFARRHAAVDYFPAFDMIALSPRHHAYLPDCLHVSDDIVAAVIRTFLALYLQQEVIAISFQERAYLAANPAVEAAVRSGQLRSGYEHWIGVEKANGRIAEP